MTLRYTEYLTKEKLERLYVKQGLTLVEVCAELGVSQRTVVKFMEQHGIERRPQGMRKKGIEARDRRIAAFEQHRADGWSWSQIAEKYGISRQRAHQIVATK